MFARQQEIASGNGEQRRPDLGDSA